MFDTVRQKEALTKILRIKSQRLKMNQAMESQPSEEQQWGKSAVNMCI